MAHNHKLESSVLRKQLHYPNFCNPNFSFIRLKLKAEPETLSFSQWEAVFRLAKRWEMEEVKTHALSALEKNLHDVDPVDKVILARTYDIRSWLAPSFNEILQRSRSLTESDVEKLGVPTAVRLMGLRDRLCPARNKRGGWTLGARLKTDINFTRLIWDAFPDSKSENMSERASARTGNPTVDTNLLAISPTREPSPARTASSSLSQPRLSHFGSASPYGVNDT
ncbi:hypothetical protein EV360DRAFT_79487 [Lentinula raphanica]|nr:hypothetical protein EV360DRAFT_79487 [Lentinula raphanica]